MWKDLGVWLKLERGRAPDSGSIMDMFRRSI
jgi:hypothetical protein